jgi:putative ATP-dependent endonuclease of OLD family
VKLSRIEIRNFRLLRRVKIDLAREERATVLVGPNNSGKTSVIDAIRLFSHRGADERKRVQVHDISHARRSAFELAQRRLDGPGDDDARIRVLRRCLPVIRIGMTFLYEDVAADLNVAKDLLMDLDEDNHEVSVRIQFAIDDALKLWKAFRDRPRPDDTSLFDVIAADIHAYYGFTYWKVSPDGKSALQLDDSSIVGNLIRVDTISAQRHMDDEESGRAAKLSRLLHAHYTTYYKKDNVAGYQEIEDAIAETSNALTKNYESAFTRLATALGSFGYPQGNVEPELKIRAEMNSATIYRDNTLVYYASPSKKQDPDHATHYDLPERYNGLGYKNLIYIVLQLESFRAAIEANPADRPGVHLIGVEEPEAHLHPQMQTVFIREVSRVLQNDAGPSGQVLVSTHSPHMVGDAGLDTIRYFRRQKGTVEVCDLSDSVTAPDDGEATYNFLKRYIKLPHCDLLFADKAILVEGQVERLLIPGMIEKVSAKEGLEHFRSQYTTILEIGGAYAHKIDPFLRFLGIPTLVVTDIDSAHADRKKCRVEDGEISTNAAIKYWLPDRANLEALHEASADEKTLGIVRIAYQTHEDQRCGRSFEEASVYANLEWIPAHLDDLMATHSTVQTAIADGLDVAAFMLGDKINKVDFALDLLTTSGWNLPAYIEEGLVWLAGQDAKR